jgi:hypothetical protein
MRIFHSLLLVSYEIENVNEIKNEILQIVQQKT